MPKDRADTISLVGPGGHLKFLHLWPGLWKGVYRNFAELKSAFRGVDKLGERYVFNIGGNKVRVIAGIAFSVQMLWVKAVLTHARYDEGDWKRHLQKLPHPGLRCIPRWVSLRRLRMKRTMSAWSNFPISWPSDCPMMRTIRYGLWSR